MIGSKTPWMNADQKKLFRQRCIDEGIEPRTHCPLCRAATSARKLVSRYCETHQDFEDFAVDVVCGHCSVRYSVMLPERCRAGGMS